MKIGQMEGELLL